MPTSEKQPEPAPTTAITASSDAASWARVAYFVCVALAAGILAAWIGAIGSGQPTSTGLHISYFLGWAVAVLSAWIVRRSRREYVSELTELEEITDEIRADGVASERQLGLLREMIEDAGVGWYRMSVNGALEQANLALALTLGFDSVEALRKACKGSSFTGATDRTSALSTLQTLGEIRNHEAGWPSAQGRRIRLIESARAVKDAKGQIRHVEGVTIAASSSEASERRAQRAEADLAEALGKLRALQNGTVPSPAADESAVEEPAPVHSPGPDSEPSHDPDPVEYDMPAPVPADETTPVVGSEPVVIRDVIEQAVADSARQAAERRLELTYRLASDVPRTVLIERDAFERALQSLVEFSVRHSARGAVVVHATPGTGVAGIMMCQFEIRSSASAVSSSDLKRAFDADDVHDGRPLRGSSGELTAAIGRRLVEHLGGGLRLESAADGRFTVHVSIPADPDRESASALDRPLEQAQILLVDDNDASRTFIAHLLEDAGARVRSTEHPAEAADLLDGDALADVIVASLSSARGAAEFVGQLKRVDADRRPPLVLVVPPDMGDGMESRSGTRIAKPVRRDRLVQAVLSVVERREPIPVPDPEPAAPTASTDRLEVLVAEDDPVNGYLMVRILENLGHGVTLVKSGGEAVRAFSSGSYDVAIMDIRMPDMTGPEASKRILETLSPSSPRPLLIGMTASTAEAEHDGCVEAGMHTCLLKPVTPEDFTQSVASFRSAPPVRHEPERVDRPSQAPSREHPPAPRPAVPHGNGTESPGDLMDEVRSYLESHHGDEPAFMAELLAVYLRNAPGLIRTMVENVESGDFAAVRQSAQALKSSCRLIGFVRLSALCRALEVAVADQASADTIAPFVESIEDTFTRARPALDAERAELVHLAALQTSL